MKKILLIHTLALLAGGALSQSRIVFNGGKLVLQNGAYLVVQNNAADALTSLTTTGGITTDKASFIRWYIGTAAATYTVPYFFNNIYLPFTFSTSAASGAGYLDLNSYNVPTWKNSDHLPPGVLHVNSGGIDNSNHIVDRFWSVAAIGYTTKPTLSNVVFTYRDEEWNATGNVISEPLLKAQRWNSTANVWDDLPPAGTANTASNSVTIPLITSPNLFQWWALVDAQFPLPVQLLRFTAKEFNNKEVHTAWSTATEYNTLHFIIERSQNGITFSAVDTVAAAGTSSTTVHYQSKDVEPFSGASFYRLKMVDRDGSYSYSAIAPVYINKGSNIFVYPNPVVRQLFVVIKTNDAKAILIVNEEGKTVMVKRAFSGTNTLDVQPLPSGPYWIKILLENMSEQYTIIKQ